jgi:micrococcal nuclease
MSINFYVYKAELVRVVDGDTVDVNIDLGFKTFVQKRIRLFNVDTYEMRGQQASPIGLKAKQFVIDLFAKYGNEFILLSHMDKSDIYSRFIGTIFLKDGEDLINLNETLKASGYDKVANDFVEGADPVLVKQTLS